MRVYISGPLTKGDVLQNLRNAENVAAAIIDLGHDPFIPHLTQYVHTRHPKPYETWMRVDLAWVEVADCVLRLPGASAGADRECARAEQLGIPVFHFLTEIEEWQKS